MGSDGGASVGGTGGATLGVLGSMGGGGAGGVNRGGAGGASTGRVIVYADGVAPCDCALATSLAACCSCLAAVTKIHCQQDLCCVQQGEGPNTKPECAGCGGVICGQCPSPPDGRRVRGREMHGDVHGRRQPLNGARPAAPRAPTSRIQKRFASAAGDRCLEFLRGV